MPPALRDRPIEGGRIFVDAGGRHFRALGRSVSAEIGRAHAEDPEFLGHLQPAGSGGALSSWSLAYFEASRQAPRRELDYLILVPTLRCNLSCSYCQVSRASVDSLKHDWSDETLGHVLALIDSVGPRPLKIEFQGGEPTLRPDLITAVIDRSTRYPDRTFVICTNLSRVDATTLAIFDRPDVFISTSLDGDLETHRRNRTGSDAATDLFRTNFEFLLTRYGPGKISALPTINPVDPPLANDLIDAFVGRGVNAIFLRPINFHGFARKQHAEALEYGDAWRAYYEAFLEQIIARNWDDRSRVLEETYFSLCLRRVMQPGHDRHVDLRNPNPLGQDYVVIDYDGTAYPTDEARMLTRSGVIDLAIGDVATGWDTPARQTLNASSTNLGDPDCDRCAYQPFCGRDLIDDLARYGRVDLPRPETEYCRRHLHIFDLVFRLIYSDDPATKYSVSRWLGLPGDGAVLGRDLQ